MKKIIGAGILAFSLFAVTACGDTNGGGNGEVAAHENYPEEQIRMIIPYSAGGATDIVFRLFASKAEEHLGESIVPVNMPGATSTVGSREVKDADPDGYTILASHDVIALAKLSGVVDYSFEAFEPVANLTQTPNIATVHSEYGWETAEEFADYVKANPGEVTWGMTAGSTSHFFAVQMMQELGIEEGEMRLIGYEGTSDAITATQAQDIHGVMTNVTSAQGHLEEGTFATLGVAHEERLAGIPDEPTFTEQGFEMTHKTSRGIFAPEGTPDEVVDKLVDAFQKAAEDPELQEEIEELGSLVEFTTGDAYKEFLNNLESDLEELADTMDF
ncbi:tripartite tricarboxylate transporter substrate binding protein [Evansella sp. LMS18]|uniref:Bug family tripartite tricarboxylate transporter substrate binding protein n=1 Tax=Evansella sp. LMS18 TaxID=2924033 RepID=UPI0020D0E486|nr:tripartite tricarboxylate transporter substrate binding protein [Evansella sp. LMS18]UTR12108.1 tripartite tricarboxylate transporter substrate binding protein [Evansella sp. LMS18]